MLCPYTVRPRVRVQAGPNRLQQHPKQCLFQMRNTYGSPFISSFYFHPRHSAGNTEIAGKLHWLTLHPQNPVFPLVSHPRRWGRNAVCLWLKATKWMQVNFQWWFVKKPRMKPPLFSLKNVNKSIKNERNTVVLPIFFFVHACWRQLNPSSWRGERGSGSGEKCFLRCHLSHLEHAPFN